MTKNDKLIKEQAIIREYEMALRRKREPEFTHREGHSIIGSIHDCSRKGFERALRAYWDRLYVGWNPYKKEGKGCWEVWQRPSTKKPVLWGYVKDGDFSTFKSSLSFHNQYAETGWEKVFSLEWKPNDYEHWVADLEYLSYNFIGRLREMDSWENKQLVAQHDEKYEEHFRKLESEENDNIKQIVKEHKRAFRDLLDYTQSGINPLDFFTKRIK